MIIWQRLLGLLTAVSIIFIVTADGYCKEGLQGSLSEIAAIPKISPEKAKRLLSWGKDPFVSPAKTVKGAVMPSSLKLSAILYAKDKPSAIINKEIVYRGDVVDGQKIVDIKKGYVILQNEVGTYRLEMNRITGREVYIKDAK